MYHNELNGANGHHGQYLCNKVCKGLIPSHGSASVF